MINSELYAGCQIYDGTLDSIRSKFPSGTIEKTKGTHYALSENRFYAVRLGQKSVVMPAMKFSPSAADAFQKLYEKEK